MAEIKIKEFESYGYKRRRPWILLVIVVIVVAVVVHNKRKPKDEEAEVQDEQVTEAVQDVVADEAKPAEVPDNKDDQIAISQLIMEAKNFEAQGADGNPKGYSEARKIYLAILKKSISPKMRSTVEGLAGKLHITLITTPNAMPEKVDYVVKSGDSIQKIARKFGTTIDLVQTSNQIKNSNLIKAGDLYRIFTGKFELEISKTRNDMLVKMNGEFFKRYQVGTGKYGKTPEGTFKLLEKQKEPVWWPKGREIPFGDKENILGTRWMTLKATGDTPDIKGYGIHGTWLPESIGKAESAGCIRMRNEEVEELYMLVPEGTTASISK